MKISSFQRLNPVIHERTRLAIMTYIISVREASFSELKAELGLTDGNLNLHMRVLETHRYARVQKSFVDRRPRTTYRVTEKGIRAFQEYVALLERILKLRRRAPADADRPEKG
ncbi:MAG: transcriptional regulator [Planctomycetes bacterium]|nr:transcriptional regulator [Planctomycetota bacterium]